MSFRVTQRIERNRELLISLQKLSEASKQAILPALSKDMLLVLVECTKNSIIGNFTLNKSQLHYMRFHKQELKCLVQKGTLDAERIRILQKGGFLMRLLAPIINRKVGPITDRVANRLISKM